MVPTPKPWLPSFHPDWRPPSPSRGGLGAALCPEEAGCQPSAAGDRRLAPSPHISPMRLCFRRGKLPTCTPSSTRPPMRPSPAGNPSRDAPSNQPLALEPGQPLRNRKQRSGMGQRPQPGRWVFPITTPSPAPPALGAARPAGPPLPAAERPLCGHRGHLPVRGRSRGRGQRQGRAGRLPGTGAARSAVSPARSRSSSRAGTPGALLRRLLPAPTPGSRCPPRHPVPSWQRCLPYAAGPPAPRLVSNCVSAPVAAARGPGTAAAAAPAE